MVIWQHFHPFRQMKCDLRHRERLKDPLHDRQNVLLAKLAGVDRHRLHIVAVFDLIYDFYRFFAVGMR